MRLLMVSSEFPPGPGGAGTFVYQLGRHLQGRGWEIGVVTRQDYASDDEIERFNRQQSLPITRLRAMPGPPTAALPVRPARGLYRLLYRVPATLASRWRAISRLIAAGRPDLVLAAGSDAALLTAVPAWRHRLPWVAVEFGRHLAPTERALTRWCFRRTSAVLFISRYSADRMRALVAPPTPSRVIPCGADAARFGVLPAQHVEAFRARLGLNRARLVLTVGSVTDRKAQDVVIRALPHVLKETPETHYLVVGLPVKAEEYRMLAHALGVADRVHFLGRVDGDTLVRCMNSCDVFAMTSRHTSNEFEGYGIAVAEAALCGKPAVVSLDCGLAEAIVPGATGLAVPADDEVATAGALLALLTDESRRRRMGEAARARALAEQAWEARVGDYDAFFRSLLRRPAAPSDGGT